eukprot:TRINITY_DN15440_c0_g1_i2.p1 TRINITY_DN15440_c0_g1~~TRINITY_DN15440_c0_g1_i2.p1  ORF type:complete len:324 (-),score=37.74 TRINITY_DN15440_c0_g1_i2:446-1417(-)
MLSGKFPGRRSSEATVQAPSNLQRNSHSETELTGITVSELRERTNVAHRQAHDAYTHHDGQQSRQAHDDMIRLIRENSNMHRELESRHNHGGGKYVKSLVFGGLDGIITTFAVVAAVAGGKLAAGVVVIMGISNLIADALSMGLGDYLSSKAELDYVKQEYEREKWETDNYLQGEVEEMIEIYVNQGFSEQDARDMINIMSKYRNVFVKTMMMEELGLLTPEEDENPAKNGLVMFVAFCIFGSVPLIAYAVFPGGNLARFICSCVVTGIVLAVLGIAKGAMTGQNKFRTALMMLLNGAAAAAASFLIAWGINRAAGISDECGA